MSSWPLTQKARALLQREQGAIVRDWGGRLPIVLIYPNSYYVGMSSLGFQTVYGLFNSFSDIICERAFLNLGRGESDVEPISLESQRPLQDFPVVGFSLSYELDYANMIRILRTAGIPPLADERRLSPLVIAGGPAVTANPAPIAPIADAIMIGEVEETMPALVRALEATIESGALLQPLAEVPGLYVPAIHHSRGAVRRQWTRDLDSWRTCSSVWSDFTEFPGMHLVEVARGCGHACRFCLAGHVYRPLRERSVAAVLELAEPGVAAGRTIGLMAPSLADCRSLRPVLQELLKRGARVSVSSLRADSLDEALVRQLVASGNDSITIAPEAGSERLRRLIGKQLEMADILAAADAADGFGFKELKLYFMLGLPTETDADVAELAALVLEIRRRFSRRLVANVSCFVPKAGTPFQWQAMAPVTVLERRLLALQVALHGARVELRAESPRWALLQAVFARGDERVGRALAAARQWSRQGLMRALRDGGVDVDAVVGARRIGEPMPWDVVDPGLPPGYLSRQASAISQQG